GCQSSPRRSAYADNPLLQSRPPLQQTNSGNERLNQIAQAGPHTVVPPPATAGATTYTPTALAAQAPGQPPAFAAATTTYAAPAAPAPEPSAPGRQANGHFGHTADYTWLHGELDRHYRGYLEVRYQSPSEEDAFGGKVRLEDDPRLAEFRAGDVVAVEGELVR